MEGFLKEEAFELGLDVQGKKWGAAWQRKTSSLRAAEHKRRKIGRKCANWVWGDGSVGVSLPVLPPLNDALG